MQKRQLLFPSIHTSIFYQQKMKIAKQMSSPGFNKTDKKTIASCSESLDGEANQETFNVLIN